MTKTNRTSWRLAVAAITSLSTVHVHAAGNVYDQGINSSIRDAGRQSLSQHALSVRNANRAAQEAGKAPPISNQKIPVELVGNYACESMQGRPCDTKTELRLMNDGKWGWSSYSGQYQIAGGAVKFVSGGGPASWGDALIKADTLTFSGDVVWRKRAQ